MQAHGQEVMFMGHNQVGWRSNPGKWCGCVTEKNGMICDEGLATFEQQHIDVAVASICADINSATNHPNNNATGIRLHCI